MSLYATFRARRWRELRGRTALPLDVGGEACVLVESLRRVECRVGAARVREVCRDESESPSRSSSLSGSLYETVSRLRFRVTAIVAR